MEIKDAIFGRRSIRVFTDKIVEKEKLEELAQAAIWAPTGGNAQPWVFIIVSEKETLRLIKAVSPGLLGIPPALIAVCANKQANVEKMGAIGEILAVMDCSMASQNIMLRAYDLQLGTCAIRSFNQQAVGEVLKTPAEIIPELLITVGYPDQDPKPPARIEDVIRWEEYE
jgi:nitroreductase